MPSHILKSQIAEVLEAGVTTHRRSDADNAFGPRVRSRMERAIRRVNRVDEQSTGELRLHRFIRRLYEGFQYKGGQVLRPEKFQLEMLKLVIPTLAKNIVGQEWGAIGSRLCRKYGWSLKRHPKLFLGQAPRRFGKTVVIAMILLTYAMVKPGSVSSTFSTSRRTSQRLKLKVLEIIEASGMMNWVKTTREEEVFICDPETANASYSAMNFYPSNPTI
jgi:hypothetical protein